MTAPAATDWTYELVPVSADRVMEVLVYGTRGARAFLSFTGTPGGAVPDQQLAAAADAHRLLLVQPLRPGYGQSTPRPGRRVVDFAADVDVVLQHLGVTDAIVMGGSGGGPHSLAMAARLPQCRAAAVVVSPAPRDAENLDFYDGMATSNQDLWRVADEGEAALRPRLEQIAAEMRPGEGLDGFKKLFGDTVSVEDGTAMAGSSGQNVAERFAKAIENGIEGWLEDDLALTTPWGYDLEAVTTPVTFWSGKQDQFVSYRHSVWMSRRVPSSDLHIYADKGHISLRQDHLPEIMADLLQKAGWEQS